MNFGHIETGQDFFNYNEAQGDIAVSNPPFSKRDTVFEKLYSLDIPFAMVIGFNGLFDNKKRFTMFKKHGVQLLVPRGRMKFNHHEKGYLTSPSFQSVYVCNRLLEQQIVFTDDVF